MDVVLASQRGLVACRAKKFRGVVVPGDAFHKELGAFLWYVARAQVMFKLSVSGSSDEQLRFHELRPRDEDQNIATGSR